MTLSELLNAVDVQGECTVAVFDYDASEYITKHNAYNVSYNEYIKNRYGEYIVYFIYNGDDGGTVIEISKD